MIGETLTTEEAIDAQGYELQLPDLRPIDWDKVKTIKDIKILLDSMGLQADYNLASEKLKSFLKAKE